ncbi:MAG: hypothetical protein AAF577_03145 [Pseudomonadota bacterium]
MSEGETAHRGAPHRYDGPAVFHLGHIKTASTYLQARVFGQPGTGSGVPGGEASRRHLVSELVVCDPYTFDACAVAQRFAALEEPVRVRGLVPVWSDEVLIGDPCQRAYHGRVVADRLIAMGRDIRVLIVVREQRSFAWSAYRQYLRDGGILKLEEFIGRPGLTPSFTPWLRPDYLEFHHAVAHWQGAIGAQHVTVLPYEMLRGDPAAFMAAIAPLFGQAALAPADTESVNVAERPAVLGLRRLANRLAPPGVLGDRPTVVQRALNRGVRYASGLAPASMDRSVERHAKGMIAALYQERFDASNARLSAMTGLDLARWGYPVG